MKEPISRKGSQKLTTPKVVLWPLLMDLYNAHPKPQSNYSEPDHVLFLQLKTVAKELVIVVGVRQRLKGKTRRLKLQSGGGGGGGLPAFFGWRWSHRE